MAAPTPDGSKDTVHFSIRAAGGTLLVLPLGQMLGFLLWQLGAWWKNAQVLHPDPIALGHHLKQ